jgi:hypothetical protein
MTSSRTLLFVTFFNVAVALFTFSQRSIRAEASTPGVLRGSALEIVDAEGKVRAAIKIEPAGPARKADGSIVKDSAIIPETVLFRLIRPDGRPSVKIATSEQGSGMSLGGGIDPAYITLNSEGGTPSIAVTNKDGRQQVVKP